jgi:glycosyltransferase involved in cell wall biosynthesis
MRILYLHMFNLGNGWGGSASMLRALQGMVIKLGHRIDVVSARFPDPYGLTTYELPFDRRLTFGPEKRAGETTIDEISTSMLEDMAIAAANKIELDAFCEGLPDLLIANHINLMALICWQLKKKFGIPYRLISYGTDTKLLLKDQRYRDLFGNAAREAEHIFAISEYVAKEVSETVGGQVEVLGGAVDPDLFFRSHGHAKTSKSLIYFGRLVTEKGIWTLLDAIERQIMATELVLVGEGPLRNEIENFLKSTPMKSQVKLLGYIPQASLREVLIQSAAVVVPSIWQEPLGLVVLEAFACGLPVIASAVGGIPEMIEDNKNGLLVPPCNASALAEAIARLFGDPALYQRMQQAVNSTTVPTYYDLAFRLIR